MGAGTAKAGGKLVEGELVLDDLPSFSDATVYVRILDIGRADGPSPMIAEQVISGVSHRAGTHERIPFKLRADPSDAKTDYTVFAHICKSGGDEIQSGDYITQQSYPVLTFGRPTRVTVRLKQV